VHLALAAALLTLAASGAGEVPLRVACRASAGRLLAAVDLAPAFDAALEDRLGSGLTSTIRLTVSASGARRAASRDFEIRFDPWTEIYAVTIRDEDGAVQTRQAADWPALQRLLGEPEPFDLGPLDELPERFTVEVRLEIDPVTARQLELTREQLTHPAGGPTAGGRSLLGTLAALLLRAPPPQVRLLRSPPMARPGPSGP
jgi:hypothetical protein